MTGQMYFDHRGFRGYFDHRPENREQQAAAADDTAPV